ncbi:hypothetical protein [Microbacterium nymphoidis]|nr:hypothetical protein [Microbacterium nymphoidis]MCD2498458.1 hypothetical protein [Microbacterium nymphoidis]
MFTILKARKRVFTNPMTDLPTVSARQTIPMPLDPAAIRAALSQAARVHL